MNLLGLIVPPSAVMTEPPPARTPLPLTVVAARTAMAACYYLAELAAQTSAASRLVATKVEELAWRLDRWLDDAEERDLL